jgi:orotidine-5'-phosphate decarboxylase
VLADAKRGDVPSTAAAYSRALTGPAPGSRPNAIHGEPADGRDALAPLIDGARERGAGVFLLVRTSNPGADDDARPRARQRPPAVGAARGA